MKIIDLIPELHAEILSGEKYLDREIKGGYACDMLSWTMSRLQGRQVWFTILNSVNVIAVASLTECACVVLTENVEMDEDVVRRAAEKEIVILKTPLATAEACIALSEASKKTI